MPEVANGVWGMKRQRQSLIRGAELLAFDITGWDRDGQENC